MSQMLTDRRRNCVAKLTSFANRVLTAFWVLAVDQPIWIEDFRFLRLVIILFLTTLSQVFLTSVIIGLVITLLFKLNVTARPVPSSLAKTFPGHAVCWHSAGAMTWVSRYQLRSYSSTHHDHHFAGHSSWLPWWWWSLSTFSARSSSSFCTVAVLRAALECAMLSIPSVGAQARACNNICLCQWFSWIFNSFLCLLSQLCIVCGSQFCV